MARVVARRQAWRWRILLGALVLFPVVFNYLSPYLILDSSSRGIINGSFLVFGLLTLSSLVVGRAWCGWLCPAGALGDVWAKAKSRPARGGRWNVTKWAIWVPWLGLIAFFAIAAGGYHAVDPLYNTEHGVSVSSLPSLVIFCGVLLLISVFSLTTGRRGFCHYACWMAPFMILGRKVQTVARWPALHLKANREACVGCGQCTQACPMSLDVRARWSRRTAWRTPSASSAAPAPTLAPSVSSGSRGDGQSKSCRFGLAASPNGGGRVPRSEVSPRRGNGTSRLDPIRPWACRAPRSASTRRPPAHPCTPDVYPEASKADY